MYDHVPGNTRSDCGSVLPSREGDLRVPGAFGYRLLEVGTCESRARHEVDVLLRVEAHLFEKRHQLLLTLLIPSGQEWKWQTVHSKKKHCIVTCKCLFSKPFHAPVDSGVVHLVDENDQMFDSGCFCQHGVLPRLAALLKARLKLPLPGWNNLTHNQWKEANIGKWSNDEEE